MKGAQWPPTIFLGSSSHLQLDTQGVINKHSTGYSLLQDGFQQWAPFTAVIGTLHLSHDIMYHV